MLWALRLRERWLLGVGALLGASGAEPAQAGFVLEPGATQIISTTSVSGFSRAFDAQGRLRRAATFSKATLETLAEHGLTRDAMVMFSFGREQEQPAYADDPGAQTRWRAMVGGRYVVARFADWAVTAQAMAGWGRSLDAAGFVGDARLVLARSLTIQGMPAFVDLQAGWRQGGKVERSEIRADATLGLHLHERWLLLAQLFGAHAPQADGLPASWRLKGAASLVWRVNESWSVQLGGFTTLYGRSAAFESGATFGIWRRF